MIDPTRRSMVRFLSRTFSPRQIAEALGVSLRTVYRVIEESERDAETLRRFIAQRNKAEGAD